MKSLNQTTCVKTWQIIVLLGASGFAFGTILSKTATALGF